MNNERYKICCKNSSKWSLLQEFVIFFIRTFINGYNLLIKTG